MTEQNQDPWAVVSQTPAPQAAPAAPAAQPAASDDDNGPAQFNRSSTQYPTMTKVDNGVAYDKTGKALGPYDENNAPTQSVQSQSVQPAKSQDPWAVVSQTPAKPAAPPAEDNGFFHNLAASFNQTLTGGESIDDLHKKAKEFINSAPPEAAKGTRYEGAAKVGALVTDLASAAWEGQKHETETGARMIGENKGLYQDTKGGLRYIQGGVPLVGPALGAIEDYFGQGEYAKGLGVALALLVPGAIEKHGVPIVDRVTGAALKDAVDNHMAAHEVYKHASQEVQTATTQAADARLEADRVRAAEANNQATAQQRIQAENTASEASANVNKAQTKLQNAKEQKAYTGTQMRNAARPLTKATPKTDVNVQGAHDDFEQAIPSAPRGPAKYSNIDRDIARPYVEKYFKENQVNPEEGVQGVVNALDSAQKGIEAQVKPEIEKRSSMPIASNPITDVRDDLRGNSQLNFVLDGMKHLTEKYGDLSNLTIGEADSLRADLNTANRQALSNGGWNVSDRLDNDPDFAARHYLAESLRNGIYDALINDGADGARELRRDETSVIRVKNAAERALPKADVPLRGSGESGPLRTKLGQKAGTIGAGVGGAVGAGAGAMAGGWLGAEVGAGVGSAAGGYVGKKLGTRFAPGDLTRNALAHRSLGVEVGGVPKGIIESSPKPGIMSPADMTAVMRESGPLHSELATHYGVFSGDQTYSDLAQRFKEDIKDKANNGITIDASEKKILGMLNQADDADRLAARQKAMEEAASGKTIGAFNKPEKVEPPMDIPGVKNGLSTQEALVHHLAQIVVGDEKGMSFSDGIQSHLHGDNKGTGNAVTAPMDMAPFLNKEGDIDPVKVVNKIGDMATTYVAGGVANDLFHDVPFTDSKAMGTNLTALKSFMKSAGMSELEASKAIAQAADEARMILSRPGMKDILEGHASVREAGLNEKYHFSPERIEQVLDDVKDGTKREATTGKSSGPSGAGERGTEAANAGNGTGREETVPRKAAAKNAEPVRQKGEGTPKGEEGPAKGSADAGPAGPEPAGESTGVSGTESKPVTFKAIQAAGVEQSLRPVSDEQRAQALHDDNNRLNELLKSGKGTPEEQAAVKQRLEENTALLEHYENKPDTLLTNETQTPLEQVYQARIVDQAGNERTEPVRGFSHKDALTRATKLANKTGGYAEVGVKNPETSPIDAHARTMYQVPKDKLLSFPESSTGRQPVETIRHELGHALVGQSQGIEQEGMLRHTHPDLKGARAAIRWDINSAVDQTTGRIRPDKIVPLLRSVMGGIAADELFNNVPRTENKNLTNIYNPSTDGSLARKILRKAGMTPEQADTLINMAIDRNIEHLTKPEVSGVIKENENVREPGLSRQYHYSPERLKAMHEEINRRLGNEQPNNGAASGEGNLRLAADVAGREAAGAGGTAEVPVQPAAEPQAINTLENPAKPVGLSVQNRENGFDVSHHDPSGRTGFLQIDKGYEPNSAVVKAVDVDENHVGKGIATSMYEKAKQELLNRGITKLKGSLEGSGPLQIRERVFGPGNTKYFSGSEEVSVAEAKRIMDEDYGYLRAETNLKPETLNTNEVADRVSTRVPEGKDASENHLEGEPLIIDRNALAKTPEKLQQKFAKTVRNYPGVKIPDSIKDPKKVMDKFVQHVSDNLKFLYNQVEPEKQIANAKWYESANKLAKGLAGEHGISEPQAAGVIATQSPQKDWDMNVSLARRITDIAAKQKDTVASPEMIQKGKDIVRLTGANEDLGKALPFIEGKKLSEVDPAFRAAWIRLYDEAHNPRDFHYIDPGTGENRGLRTNANGAPSKVAWGSLPQIENALSILEDGSRKNISERVGGMHKVRNFYNNIIDPTNDQDVTIDTHAVAAGLIQPLGGSADEVLDNFGTAGKHTGTGVKGTYPLYADAYRQAAADLGIKPRELQSVVWEHVRNMFPSEWKSPETEMQVKKVWKKYSDGKQSLNKTRQEVLDISEQAQKQVADARAETRAKADAKAQKALDKQKKKSDNEAGITALGGGQ